MRRWLLAAAGGLLVVLVVAQLVLPGIAERRLRSDLARHGRDVRVDVAAFPGVKLLWHRADRVTIRVGSYRTGGGGSGTSLPDLLARTKSTAKLDVDIATLDVPRLRLHDVRLHKDGDALTGRVRMTRADVDRALPVDLHLAGAQTAPDQLSVSGSTTVFGRRLSGGAVIRVADGRIVLRPAGVPFASFVTVPVFSDDRVAVDGISAVPAPGGFAVTAKGHLR
jgi:LmeA-like phospholipid-binding